MRNVQVGKYAQLHFKTPPQPMHFISIDLIGPFATPNNDPHYALTVTCMLTGHFCPSKDKHCY